MLGKTPANALETKAFATLGRVSRDLLSCTVSAFDALPRSQRTRLFAPALLLDPDVPIDPQRLTAALGEEIVQRVGVQVFDDPGAEEERPGRIRVYEPVGRGLLLSGSHLLGQRSANGNFSRLFQSSYLPAEIQHDCAPQIVDGQPQVVCQVRNCRLPGQLSAHRGVGARSRPRHRGVGDSVMLQGVNYFSVDAKVRFYRQPNRRPRARRRRTRGGRHRHAGDRGRQRATRT